MGRGSPRKGNSRVHSRTPWKASRHYTPRLFPPISSGRCSLVRRGLLAGSYHFLNQRYSCCNHGTIYLKTTLFSPLLLCSNVLPFFFRHAKQLYNQYKLRLCCFYNFHLISPVWPATYPFIIFCFSTSTLPWSTLRITQLSCASSNLYN